MPVLSILADRGGRATRGEVLDELEIRMKRNFLPADLEPLPSKGKVLRWRSTANFARLHLVREGLMLDSREKGVWEISPAGREAVQRGGFE